MWEKDRRLLSYSEYCNKLLDSSTYYWFHRPIVFYRDLDEKTPEERQRMVDSLYDLKHFLENIPMQSAQRTEMRQKNRRTARGAADITLSPSSGGAPGT
jgi:hypothetical protein